MFQTRLARLEQDDSQANGGEEEKVSVVPVKSKKQTKEEGAKAN